jgi:hypothetical protein
VGGILRKTLPLLNEAAPSMVSECGLTVVIVPLLPKPRLVSTTMEQFVLLRKRSKAFALYSNPLEPSSSLMCSNVKASSSIIRSKVIEKAGRVWPIRLQFGRRVKVSWALAKTVMEKKISNVMQLLISNLIGLS